MRKRDDEDAPSWNTRSAPPGEALPLGKALPEELQGPYHQDEVGTFNANGWGFSVLLPEEFWGCDPEELPTDVLAHAQLLEHTIRRALASSSSGVGEAHEKADAILADLDAK